MLTSPSDALSGVRGGPVSLGLLVFTATGLSGALDAPARTAGGPTGSPDPARRRTLRHRPHRRPHRSSAR